MILRGYERPIVAIPCGAYDGMFNLKSCHQQAWLKHLILLFSKEIFFNDILRTTAFP